ncbi:hypothetical protein RGU73_01700 [Neobacillus cucumis]|nr:hypothetical protein [Neobacillus cucumis]MDR4945168.1 hypothetical protein [Neobacillus cucumis]
MFAAAKNICCPQTSSSGKQKALVSICTTGSGTAKELEDILRVIVSKVSEEPIIDGEVNLLLNIKG